MSVKFNYGNSPQSFPESATFFQSLMEAAIYDNSNRTFVTLLKQTARTVEDGKVNEFWIEIKKILDTVLTTPLEKFLKKDTEAYNRFIKVRVKGAGSVDNESNIKFLQDKTLKDLLDADVKNRLLGAGGATEEFGKNFDELPAFDIEEFLELKGDADVAYDVILREKMEDGIPSRMYNITHSKETSAMDAMIESKIWNYDDGDMQNAKLEHITELTGQSPKFVKSGGKSKLDIQTINYSFAVPPSVIRTMEKGFAGDFVTEYTLTKEENKRVFTEGKTTKIMGGKFEMLNPATWPRGFIMGIFESKKPIGTASNSKKVYAIKEGKTSKYFSMELANAEANNIDIIWPAEGVGTPAGFIGKNKLVFLRAVKDKLDDPLTVVTMKLEANIKFKSTTKATFGEVATATNKKKTSNVRFSKTIHVNKETKAILSDEDYDRLDASEKAKYKPVDKLLTEQEIEELSSKAFKNKNTGETISEKAWKELKQEEKDNYVSDLRVFDPVKLHEETDKPEGTISYKDMEEFQKDVLSVSSIGADNIEKLFKNAVVDVDIIFKFHGKFNMNPYRVGSNRPMNTHINKGKKVIRAIVKAIKIKAE